MSKIKALSFGYVGGNANPEWADGFGGISNLPYVKWAREIAADDHMDILGFIA